MSFIDYMEQELGPAKYNTAETEANWDCPILYGFQKKIPYAYWETNRLVF